MTSSATTIGIIGAGKVGTVLARLALAAGHRVLISASREPERIALIVDVLAPGAEALATSEVIDASDVVILALPLRSLSALPADALRGRLVLDAMNYWEPTDGSLPEYADDSRGTSEIVASHLPGTRFVKTFSHLGYHDLDERGLPAGSPGRIALALAGDDPLALAEAAAIVDSFGFEPYLAGPLTAGRAFQAHTPAFGIPMTRDHLAAAIAGA